jgi:hypothetical protein
MNSNHNDDEKPKPPQDASAITERERCPACNGTGVRERVNQDSPAVRYCLECQGSGRKAPVKALVPITDIPANIPCDFCRAVPAVRGYLCENFSLSGVPIFSRSVGLWMVCDKCSELVSAREWPTLAERAYQSFADRCGVGDHEANTVRAEFSELIAQFAAHCSDS